MDSGGNVNNTVTNGQGAEWLNACAELRGENFTVRKDAGDFAITPSGCPQSDIAISAAIKLSYECVAMADNSFVRDTQKDLVRQFIQLAFLRGYSLGVAK